MISYFKEKLIINAKVIFFFVRFLKVSLISDEKKLHDPHKYCSPEYCVDIKSIQGCSSIGTSLPKVIWMYWDDLVLPKYLGNIVSNIKESNPSYEVRVLNRVTVFKYLPSDLFRGNVQLSHAHKSDVIRLFLLKEFGGIWIDISTILNEDLSWVEMCYKHFPYDLVGFFRKVSTENMNKPIIENWFMASPKNNKFITHWYDEFSKIIDLGADGYYELLRSRSDFNIIKQNISNPSYLLSYLSAQIVMNKNDGEYSFFLKCCEESAFFYQRINFWKPHLISFELSRLDISDVDFKIIKLTKSDRMLLPIIGRMKLYSRESIFGIILKK